MGAMVDEAQLRSVMGFVNSGKLEGARCLIGGTIAHEKTGGA
jgi:acyl-CoA reductase-like NAD-dependent aldehyde dehydrogenase